MRLISRVFSRSWMFLLTIPLSIFMWWVLLYLPPASFYIQAQSITVEDSDTDTPVVMHVLRTIKRNFTGRYFVQVRSLNIDGSTTTVCEGTGSGPYSVEASLPDPLYLGWWAGNKDCNIMDREGAYQISTVWVVNTPLGPRSTKPIISNVFVVRNTESCRGYKVSSRGIIHGPDSRYRDMVVGPCHPTLEEAVKYRDMEFGE